MSWEGFQIECWSALGPAGSSPGDGVGFCVLRRLWRGNDERGDKWLGRTR